MAGDINYARGAVSTVLSRVREIHLLSSSEPICSILSRASFHLAPLLSWLKRIFSENRMRVCISIHTIRMHAETDISIGPGEYRRVRKRVEWASLRAKRITLPSPKEKESVMPIVNLQILAGGWVWIGLLLLLLQSVRYSFSSFPCITKSNSPRWRKNMEFYFTIIVFSDGYQEFQRVRKSESSRVRIYLTVNAEYGFCVYGDELRSVELSLICAHLQVYSRFGEVFFLGME